MISGALYTFLYAAFLLGAVLILSELAKDI